MAPLSIGFSPVLNVKRFCLNSAEGWGGGARCVRNHARPKAAISASSPASVSGQGRAPSPGPAPRDHPLPKGEGKTPEDFGSPLPPWGEGLGVREPTPTDERPESVS